MLDASGNRYNHFWNRCNQESAKKFLRALSFLTKQKPKFFIVREAHFLYNKKMKQPSFEEFEATSLYCPHCKSAMPVRKRLLLVLPEGDEYEYLCARCSTSVGTKIDKSAPPLEILLKP
jgi:DNA-directed RNA polymerase subunit RPC12/RpoP